MQRGQKRPPLSDATAPKVKNNKSASAQAKALASDDESSHPGDSQSAFLVEESTGTVKSTLTSSTRSPVVENEYTQRLEVLQRIQEITGGCLIDLPQICVAGDQSSGKSSLLQSLTGVPFPENSGICTKVAARVQCRQDKQRDAVLFEIKDPSTDEWEATPLEKVSSRILKVQKSLLGDHKKAGKICVDHEINVRVSGPSHMDIIVNDLPGLIHTGPEKEETHALIKKYVRRERTLILLVSEAQRDDETVAAIELAKGVDPEGRRTMRILTKFDSFDSKGSKATAVRLVKSEDGMHLGTHAVACRVKGERGYDAAAEMDTFRSLPLPAQRVGIESLKSRLPKVFAELIGANLPGMLESVCRQRHDAEVELQDIGSTATDGHLMIHKFCQVALEACDTVQERLTIPMRLLQDEVHKTGGLITEDFTSQHFTENVFQVPFFQGIAPYKRCWQEVLEKWRVILAVYIDAAEDVVDKSLTDVDLKFGSGASQRFCKAVATLWKRFCKESLFPSFREACQATVKKEAPFGTVNHYLTDKFAEEMVLPDALMHDFLEALWEYEGEDGYITADRDTLRETLMEARARWAKKHASKTLHEQQQHRIFATLKANWAVEKKTFTDMIHKESVQMLEKRRLWIQSELQASKEVLQDALEDEDTVQKRERLNTTISKMWACEAEIRKIM